MLAQLLLFIFTYKASAAVHLHEIKDIKITKSFAAMTGPEFEELIVFPDIPKNEDFWVTGLRVEILRDGKNSTQYLCHSRLLEAEVKGPLNPKYRANGRIKTLGIRPLFAISQGQPEMHLPEGFGLRVRAEDGTRGVKFGIQLQNPSFSGQAFPLRIRTKIDYMSAVEGRAQKIRPLFPSRMLLMNGGKPHWDVPPGQHQFKSEFEPHADGIAKVRVHAIRLHVHAFATKMELYDLTEGKSLWVGKATTDAKNETVESVEFYSDKNGFELDLTHKYEVRAWYDNTLSKPIDAMAFMTLFSTAEIRLQ